MRKQILTKIIATIVFATTLLLGNVGVTKAALQANLNTQYKKTDNPINWMKNFREMEKAGGAMGLDETLKNDLTAQSNSNNIDVHMMRSTEYGAIAILSASGYGNLAQIKGNNVTTTGNNTGMLVNTSAYENVAGGNGGYIFSGTDARYYDAYGDVKVGDALGAATDANPGCRSWHSSSFNWFSERNPYWLRGNGGIFACKGSGSGYTDYRSQFCRGVAVCGKDF